MAEAAKAEDEQVMYEEGVEGYEDMIPMEGAESLGGEQSVEVSWPLQHCVVVAWGMHGQQCGHAAWQRACPFSPGVCCYCDEAACMLMCDRLHMRRLHRLCVCVPVPGAGGAQDEAR